CPQDIEDAGAEAEEQENDQPPWRGSRHPVDEPADADPDRYPRDELAGQLESLGVAGGASALVRFAFPLEPVRLPCRKRCFKFTPAALEIVGAGFRSALAVRARSEE